MPAMTLALPLLRTVSMYFTTLFSQEISHEIRNPLTGVLSVLHLLRATQLDENQRKLLDTADNTGRALLSLLDEMLQRARGENTDDIVVNSYFLLDELIQPLLMLFSCQAQQKGVILVANVHPSSPKHLHSDAGKIRQILSNLLSNAVRFTDSGIIKLQISIETQAGDDSALCFRIIDSGTGIPATALQRIFEPYQQSGNAQQRRGGTGLGLSISQRLARAMHGDIYVHSVEGRGSIFTLMLPWCSTPTTTRKVQHTLRVLVIDDSDIHRIAAHSLLENLGHTVVTASCAQEAIAVLQEQYFDVVFLDVHLPDMHHTLAIKSIIGSTMSGNITPHIIAVSAWLDNNDVTQLLACGAHAVCTKPLDPLELQQMLLALCTSTAN